MLAAASLVEGNYTGISSASSASDFVPGTNVPKSKMNGGGWGAWFIGDPYGGDSATFKYNYGNGFGFGAYASGSWPAAAELKPEEAWNIDTKIDDGNPSAGKIIAREGLNSFGNTTTCTTAASATDYTGAYKLSVTTLTCSLLFAKAY